MGIENREYLRDEYDDGPTRLVRRAPASMLVKLIGLTVVVFVLQLLMKNSAGESSITQWLQLVGEDVYRRGQVWRLLTYAFCHAESMPLHLIFNMVALYAVGSMLIQLTGEREFLWFYLASAVFAGICSLVFYTLIKRHPSILGASGAVYAVFCVVAMHYPRQSILLFGVIPIEMRWLLAIYIGMDVLPIVSGLTDVTRVAHSAHLGGLLFGYLYFKWNMRLTRWWDQFAGRVAMKRRARNLKIFAPSVPPESNLEAQMDEILEKISREGEASLTARERNILTQASRKLRKDRS